MTPSSPPAWPLRRTVLCMVLLVALVETALLFAGNGGVLRGVLLDPDCYMHLQRAWRLMTGGWRPDGFDPRVNAPFGFAIHWTSLFDGLLVDGAWPLAALGMAPRAALYLWGSLVSPLLMMLSLAAFAAGTQRWVSGLSFLWLTVLLFTQPQLSGAFLAGRPDHHSLILGLMLMQLAWLYALCDGRAAGGRTAVPLALSVGVAAGVQLCTSIEALLTILLVSVAVALLWAGFARNILRLLALYWAGCFASVLAWLALTCGPHAFQPLYDRVSIVHAVVLADGLAAILLAGLLARRLPRALALGLAGLLAAVLIAVTYPDFFLGPWPRLDPAVKAWHRQIRELQPLLPDSWTHLADFLSQLAAPMLALPLAIQSVRRGDGATRQAMLVSLCGFAVFVPLALAQMRWSAEVQAAMLLPWTLTTQRLMRSRLALRLGSGAVPLRSLLLMAALLLQVVPQLLVRPPDRVPAAATVCNWTAAARALAALGPQRGIVMTELWYGPEILWRTSFDVVGAPYEIAPALADTAVFESGAPAAARDVLAHRRVSYVLNCGPGRALAGLQPVAFAAPGFHLYRVAALRFEPAH